MALTIAITVLALDLHAPLGIAGGVPYVAMVLCGCWMRYRAALFFLAALATILTIIGYFLSPMGSSSSGLLQ